MTATPTEPAPPHTDPANTPPPPDGATSGSVFALQLADLSPADPLRWLAAGWRDFVGCPKIGLFYGLCFFLMGHALWWVFQAAPAYVLALSAGFLLMGPFLCLGLYDASRASETGRRPSLRASLTAWRPTKGTMAIFAGVLLILEMLWGRASLVVFAVFFDTGMPTTASVLEAVFNPRNWEFVAVYLVVGGAFAALVFSTCVVSIPMILDRDTDAITAGIASIQAVTGRTGVMIVWGALIVALVIGALLLPWALGVLLVGPWLGHASWHAYRGCFAWR